MNISIVTPSYNQAEFIERTIKSVVDQKGDFELEYIIIDGGSTDGSVDIIKRYAEQDSRIQWVSEPDNGQSQAINKGLRRATGDIVGWLNSDDMYEDGALQKIAQSFTQQPDTQWVTGYCHIIDEHDQEMRQSITGYKNFWLRHFSYNVLLILNCISQPATFWRRTILEEIGLLNEDEHLVMDYEYWCRIGQHNKPIILEEYLAQFRSYAKNKSSQGFIEQFQRETEVAAHYSSQSSIRWLHRIHAGLISMLYKLMN